MNYSINYIRAVEKIKKALEMVKSIDVNVFNFKNKFKFIVANLIKSS